MLPARPLKEHLDRRRAGEAAGELLAVVAEDLAGHSQLTADDRAKILGGNALRLHGIDAAELLRRVEGDEFAQRRAAGRVRPWSRLHSAPMTTGATVAPGAQP